VLDRCKLMAADPRETWVPLAFCGGVSPACQLWQAWHHMIQSRQQKSERIRNNAAGQQRRLATTLLQHIGRDLDTHKSWWSCRGWIKRSKSSI
jgi:hypothetical protein